MLVSCLRNKMVTKSVAMVLVVMFSLVFYTGSTPEAEAQEVYAEANQDGWKVGIKVDLLKLYDRIFGDSSSNNNSSCSCGCGSSNSSCSC